MKVEYSEMRYEMEANRVERTTRWAQLSLYLNKIQYRVRLEHKAIIYLKS